MIRVFHIAFIVLCSIGFLLFSSCQKKENQEHSVDDVQETTLAKDSSQEETETQNKLKSASITHFEEKEDLKPLVDLSYEVGVFDEVLKLWDQGETKNAVKKFLCINWESPTIFSETSNLNLTEQEFVSLPESERNTIQQKCLKLAKTTRELVNHVLGLGKISLATEDYDISESHFNTVLHCGRALARPQSMAIIKAVGRGVERAALKELTQLYTRTGDEVKLKAIQERPSKLSDSVGNN